MASPKPSKPLEALTNSQALYLGKFARLDALRNGLLAEAQSGFSQNDEGLTGGEKAADHAELTRLRGVDDAQIAA
jgi:hypothetical protein